MSCPRLRTTRQEINVSSLILQVLSPLAYAMVMGEIWQSTRLVDKVTVTSHVERLESSHLEMSSPFWKGLQESTLTGLKDAPLHRSQVNWSVVKPGLFHKSRVGWIALFDDQTSSFLDQAHSTSFPWPIAMHDFGITWKTMDGFTS
ncbi:hypothetical protein SADUNF_Sadunf14G0031600 [Salix dunnii]|uniref:Uncharacterized protein n=1 Tax=Salix dunnii TaxID=1413687 RepID=A0A835MT77_9ROSI|nr:hypothetical protein SADUNF_Sadunf14G0031600 [Salix dunnii]